MVSSNSLKKESEPPRCITIERFTDKKILARCAITSLDAQFTHHVRVTNTPLPFI